MSDLLIKDIRSGDVFYEIEYGTAFKMEALEDGVCHSDAFNDGGGKSRNQWSVRVKLLNQNDKEIRLLQTEGLEYYGPKLYTYLAYSGVTEK